MQPSQISYHYLHFDKLEAKNVVLIIQVFLLHFHVVKIGSYIFIHWLELRLCVAQDMVNFTFAGDCLVDVRSPFVGEHLWEMGLTQGYTRDNMIDF